MKPADVPGVSRLSCVAGLVVAVSLAFACDGRESCPSRPCDPTSNGDPFDLLHWCGTNDECFRDGATPACTDAGASPAPPCASGPADISETITFPVGKLWSTLGDRHDLVVMYSSCDSDSQPPPTFKDVEILFDGKPGLCTSANPCDPAGLRTVTTCLGVPSTVQTITFSYTYLRAEGQAGLEISMQDTTCSYFCS